MSKSSKTFKSFADFFAQTQEASNPVVSDVALTASIEDTTVVAETVSVSIEAQPEATAVADQTSATDESTDVVDAEGATDKPVYARPYLPRGKYFAMLRAQGLLRPRETNAPAKAKAAPKASVVKAEKPEGQNTYLPRGQWFKMMRETGQLKGRNAPKVVEAPSV